MESVFSRIVRSLRHIIADIEHLLIEEVNIQCHIECCVSIIRGMAKVTTPNVRL